MITSQNVLDFWFQELTPKQWFEVDLSLDQVIKERFEKTLVLASSEGIPSWRQNPSGRLAEIILLDQFSRNIYRGKPESFSQDELALELSKEAVDLKLDLELSTTEKSFLYMPYMHSESLEVHNQAIKLFSTDGLENSLAFEHKHRIIIERFGRYPHRNKILGRTSTAEEIEFLTGPNSSF